MMNSVEVNSPLRSPSSEFKMDQSVSSSSGPVSTPSKPDHFEKISNDVFTGAIMPYLQRDKKLYESLALVSRKHRQMIGAFLPARRISLNHICKCYVSVDYSRSYLPDDEEKLFEEFKANLSESLPRIVDIFTNPYSRGVNYPRRDLVIDSSKVSCYTLAYRLNKFILEEILARCAHKKWFFCRIDVTGTSYLEILIDLIKQANLDFIEQLVLNVVPLYGCPMSGNAKNIEKLLNEFFGSPLFRQSSLKKLSIVSEISPEARHGNLKFENCLNHENACSEKFMLENLPMWDMPELDHLQFINIPDADRYLNALPPLASLRKFRLDGVFNDLDISALVESFVDKFPSLTSVEIKAIGPISRVPVREQIRGRLPGLQHMHIAQLSESDGRAPERLVDVLRF